MSHRDDRKFETGELRDVIRVRAGGVDEVFAPGRAAICLHASHAVVVDLDFLDEGSSGKANAHLTAGVLVRFGHAPGRHPAIRRAPKHRPGGCELHQWPATFRFRSVDEAGLQPGGVGCLQEPPKLHCASLAQRDTQRTHFMPVRLHLGPLQFAKDRNRVHGEFDTLGGVAHLAAQSRALGRGHLADIAGAFDQQNVGLASLRERIGHSAADGAAADDDDFSVGELIRFHLL